MYSRGRWTLYSLITCLTCKTGTLVHQEQWGVLEPRGNREQPVPKVPGRRRHNKLVYSTVRVGHVIPNDIAEP